MRARLGASLIAAVVLVLGASLASAVARAPGAQPSASPTPGGASGESSPTRHTPRARPSASRTRPSRPASARPSRVAVAPTPGDAAVDCARVACVALTFDDGPKASTTPRLLAELRSLHASATFFPIGQNATAHPDIVRDEWAQGEVVGDHSWSHADLADLDAAGARREMLRDASALRAASGHAPYLVRPPYGAWNEDVRTGVAGMNAAMILWNVDSQDWRTRDAAATERAVLRHARRGSIVLLHDIYPSTVAAVPRIVADLRARGLTPVTVPTLLGSDLGVGWTYYGQRDLIHPGTTRQTTR